MVCVALDGDLELLKALAEASAAGLFVVGEGDMQLESMLLPDL